MRVVKPFTLPQFLQLEFFLTNGEVGDKLQEDKPSSGELYTLPTPSSYKLSFGGIRPFPRGADERVMLVSDLDGEMEADEQVLLVSDLDGEIAEIMPGTPYALCWCILRPASSLGCTPPPQAPCLAM